MIDRLGPHSQPLPRVQPGVGFKAVGRSGSLFKQALAEELQEVSQSHALAPADQNHLESQAYRTVAPRRPAGSTIPPSMLPLIQEVQQIAENSGFIGVTADEVIRAYRSGQSFLADYTV